MKLKLLSDLHIEFSKFNVEYNGEDVLILAGDISSKFEDTLSLVNSYLKLSEHVQIIYVLGNHEYYERTIEETKNFWKNVNIDRFHFLQDESVVINGIRFYGTTLWTDLEKGDYKTKILAETCINDFIHIKEFSPEKFIEMHLLQKTLLENAIRWSVEPMIVVTHHLPSFKSIHKKYGIGPLNAAFACTDMDNLIQNPKVKVWCHGHTHSSVDYKDGETRVVCNPRGYSRKSGECENKEFKKDFIFTVETSELLESCKYSFKDLIHASRSNIDIEELYSMSQSDRNAEVKKMCAAAGWYWKDVEKLETFTSFSPYKI